MIPETELFIHDLFARCLNAAPSAFLTLTAIHPNGDRPTPSRHVPLGDSAKLERAIANLWLANQRGWGAYLGIAPRQHHLGRWSRGGKSDLACLPALFVDIDQPDDALIQLGWFDLPASCILHSGRGYHAYWFLDTPTTDLALADRALRGLAQHLNGDEALTVAQSMRLPGTINTKAGRDAAPCTFFSYHPERIYSLEEFAPFLPKTSPHAQRFISWHPHDDHERAPSDLAAITSAVLQQLDGRPRSSGFVAARCPYPHEKDHPGMHFSYNPETGWGYCFGKHGKIPPSEMARLLGGISSASASVDAA